MASIVPIGGAAEGKPNARAHVCKLNPPTLVGAPPAAEMVLLNVDLGATGVTLEYDLPHAERLLEDLQTMVQLMKTKPYARARAKGETWQPH